MTVSELIKKLEYVKDKEREIVIIGENEGIFKIDFVESSQQVHDDVLVYTIEIQ